MCKQKSTPQKITLINTDQIKRFKAGEKNKIGTPECILEEYTLESGHCRMNDDKDAPPMKEYKNAEGFEYSWGHILERRVGHFIVMDFCLGNLLSRYLRTGKRLHDLQREFYCALERTLPYTTRDLVEVLALEKDWLLIPCTTIGVFSLVIHRADEEEARQWAALDLLCEAMPEIIKELEDKIDKAKR